MQLLLFLTEIKANEVPLSDVVISTQLQKKLDDYDSIGPHVAIARRMKAKNISVGPGSMIRYVIVRGQGRLRDKARLPEEITPKDYDADYYINNQIIPAVEKIFEVMGFSKDDLLQTKEQAKLERFF